MKKSIFFGLLGIVLLAGVSFKDITNPLVGKWELHGIDHGSPFTLLAIFRANGTYDGFINKKSFVSGSYNMKHDTLYISDPTCNAKYFGTYKVEYFGKPDSLKFHVLQDTCTGRREGTNGFTFIKVK